MSDGIKVGGPGRVGGPSRTTKKQGKSGSSFAEALTSLSSAEDTPEMESMASVDSIGGLLSLQEAPDAEDRPARRRAVTHGSSLLDGLEEIRLGLLTGSIPMEKLGRLAQALRSRKGQSGDAELEDLIAQIELRTEVELAKLQRR
tara:strand:- start:79972 stop:80406 length:435 start_codon:yes stop_codon:yes gene_type:complete